MFWAILLNVQIFTHSFYSLVIMTGPYASHDASEIELVYVCINGTGAGDTCNLVCPDPKK
jgi:hypothetical protein